MTRTSSVRTAVLTASAFALGVWFAGSPAEATSGDESPYVPFDQLSRVLVLVERGYVEPAEREELVEGAIRGMVAELDPHSAYMDAEDYALFRGDTDGEFGGIGVEVAVQNGAVTVVAPIDGGPAGRAGIRSGDVILAVDGRGVRGMPLEKLIGIMRGEAGTPVRLVIGREGEAEPIDVTLVREVIEVSSVFGKLLLGDVAYLRLKQFQDGTHTEMLATIGDLREASTRGDLSGVILDMRYNPGGLVHEAEAVADEFLATGSIYSTRHRGQVIEEVFASVGGSLSTEPMVALVNEYSASSAELVAGALQDNGRAELIGARTFGKGSVQTIFELPGATGMRLTTMRYYTPAARSIQALGIVPDVALTVPADTDPFLYKEAELDNALAQESADAVEPKVVIQRPDPFEPEEGIARSAEELAADPRTTADFALKVAYERLLARTASRP